MQKPVPDSGLIYRELSSGTGPSPAASDVVKVHYRGTLINGTEFDSSYRRNDPAQFPAGRCDPKDDNAVRPVTIDASICLSQLSPLPTFGCYPRPDLPDCSTR